MMTNSWGYKLDYAKEISADLREIEQTERHVPLAKALTEAERAKGSYHLDVVWFLLANIPERMPLLGLSPDDVHLLVWLLDVDGYDADLKSFGIDAERPPLGVGGWYGRAQAVSKRLHEQFGNYVIADPEPLLKKLRSRLARHRRNQGRFG